MSDQAPERPEDDVEMGFFEHLAELRTRLLHSLYGILPGMAVAGFFYLELWQWFFEPYSQAWWRVREAGVIDLPGDAPELITLTPYSMFVSYLKVVICAAVVLTAPWIFWQLWKFVSPGLYRREKRLAIPFVLVSTVFFVGGVMFGYYVVFPILFEYFLTLVPDPSNAVVRVNPMYSVDEVFSLEFRLLIAFGLVFELPVVNSFLAMAGIVNWRQLLAFSRWWVLVAAVLSALLTPPDWTSQLLMLGPLIILYFVSIAFAYVFGKAAPAPAPD